MVFWGKSCTLSILQLYCERSRFLLRHKETVAEFNLCTELLGSQFSLGQALARRNGVYCSKWVLEHQNNDVIQSKNELCNGLILQLLAVRDKRSLYIKIADRLHNLRTISHKDIANQLRKAEETILFYVPLAEQLEMKSAAEEMRSISVKVLNDGNKNGTKVWKIE